MLIIRPMDATVEIEERVRRHLAALGAEFTTIPCDPELADTAAFCAHYGYPLEMSANTIIVAARREPGVACACVVLATNRLDVKQSPEHRGCCQHWDDVWSARRNS